MSTVASGPASLPREDLADYLLDLGVLLASYGCPSYRLEDVLRAVADVEGQHADPFALPTGLFLRVTSKDGSGPQIVRMSRVKDWGVDLARLTLLDEILTAVIERKATVEEARARIKEAMRRRPPWSPLLVFCASIVLSGAAAIFFQGGYLDVFVAAIVGAVIAGSRLALAGRVHSSRRNARILLTDFLGGLFATACAGLAVLVWPEARPMVIVPAGAIALFPGMTFTTGVAEVAQKHVVSGGARLVESGVTLLLIFFGVALMDGLAEVLHLHLPSWIAPATTPVGLSFGWQAAALAASSIAFAAIFQVPWKWLWATVVSSATGWIVATFLVRWHFPGHVAAFCAALAVCILANGLSRVTKRPAQLFQLPGMMLLVPGSFGFLSLGDYFEGKVVDGTARVFTMMLVGAALVIGVLVANVVVPSRKLL